MNLLLLSISLPELFHFGAVLVLFFSSRSSHHALCPNYETTCLATSMLMDNNGQEFRTGFFYKR